MSAVLWVLAVVLAVFGVVELVTGHIVLGVVLIALACLVGPGGYSIGRGRY